MVSVEQFGDDYYLRKENSGSELSKCPQMPLCEEEKTEGNIVRIACASSEDTKYAQGLPSSPLNRNLSGIKIPLYRFGSPPAKGTGSYSGSTCTAEEEHSLLDSLLLAQWEDCTWKGLLRYDVTTCKTKVISGRRKFLAQLNEDWKSFMELEESKALQRLDPFNFNCMKTVREGLLFCIASGEKVKSELITSSMVPNDASLIIINANPVEYGHVFLMPHTFYHPSRALDAISLEMAARVAVEINNCSFHAFYDSPKSTSADHLFFQGCYFANPLPVDLVPVVHVAGDWQGKGIEICEIADYPVKALLFKGNDNFKSLVNMVSAICSTLQDQNTPFSLLISASGTKMFLFPQVNMPANDNLSAWECGGFFIFKNRTDFDGATEDALTKRLSAISLDEDGFKSVKQLCCSVASKLVR